MRSTEGVITIVSINCTHNRFHICTLGYTIDSLQSPPASGMSIIAKSHRQSQSSSPREAVILA